MEVINAFLDLYRVLLCVFLRSTIAYDVYRKLGITKSLRSSQVNVGGYYGLVSFSSGVSTVNLLCSNIAITAFIDKLPWSLHCYYLNRFITTKVLQLSAYSEWVHHTKGNY